MSSNLYLMLIYYFVLREMQIWSGEVLCGEMQVFSDEVSKTSESFCTW